MIVEKSNVSYVTPGLWCDMDPGARVWELAHSDSRTTQAYTKAHDA
jgi:hypothetical protein